MLPYRVYGLSEPFRPNGAQGCPINGHRNRPDEAPQALPFTLIGAYHVGADPQRDRRVGMPKGPHRPRQLITANDQQRTARVSQLVRRAEAVSTPAQDEYGACSLLRRRLVIELTARRGHS
jgi:hypothetical protein